MAALGLLWAGVGAAAPDEVRTIRIGVDINAPPLSSGFVDGVPVPGQLPEGFTPALLREMQATGLVKFEISANFWAPTMKKFTTGQIDAVANVIMTDERRENMWYSIPHATLHAATYTRAGDPAITRKEQLAGKVMVMLKGTSSLLLAQKNNGWGASIVIEESWAKVLQRVRQGEGDIAVLTNLPPLKRTWDEEGLRRDFMEDIFYQFHIVVRRGDRDGLEQINAALAQVKYTGIYDELHDQ